MSFTLSSDICCDPSLPWREILRKTDPCTIPVAPSQSMIASLTHSGRLMLRIFPPFTPQSDEPPLSVALLNRRDLQLHQLPPP